MSGQSRIRRPSLTSPCPFESKSIYFLLALLLFLFIISFPVRLVMPSFEEADITYANGEKTLHYLTAGPSSGELLFFMHGWPGIGKTWHHQITYFSSLGYFVVAPDMPGYGGSTARKVTSDYSQENVIEGMLTLLKHLGHEKAIWIAHDWGCGTLWTIARCYPEVCKAVCGMTVPYAVLEFGMNEAVKYVDRNIYPEDKYPYGQWEYQALYEQDFENATAWFEKDIRGLLKALWTKGNPTSLDKPAMTAGVLKTGWFGGAPQPPPASSIPDEASVIDKETFDELVAAMEKNGFWPADAWYMNHKANTEFNEKHGGREKRLEMPVLFVEAKYDVICFTYGSRLGEPQEKLCDDLTLVSLDAGHFVPLEKWEEVNDAIGKWLKEKVKV